VASWESLDTPIILLAQAARFLLYCFGPIAYKWGVTTETQNDMDFSGQSQPNDGHTAWQRQRQQARSLVSQRLGLPLGHDAEVRLLDGVVLRGTLRLREELLFFELQDLGNVELAIGRATFRQSEVESCVRLD